MLPKLPLAKLPADTANLICSSQVITTASTAVKELMENSIDAGATNIEIKLENYGLDKIEVKDNGKGVSHEDVYFMCKKSYTSKIGCFSDLRKITSYGFRGEALNALCSVSNVSVTTITEGDEFANTYKYDCNGNVILTQVSHIIKGTSVVIEDLFRHFPVRKNLMSTGRRKVEELKKVELVIKALALIHPRLRVVFSHNKFVIWQKNSVPSLKLSFTQVVSPTIVKQLYDLRHTCSEVTFHLLIPEKGCNIAATCYGNVGDAVYVFVNHRPVKNKKVEKAVQGEIYTYFGNEIPSGKYPTCVISIVLSPKDVDINVEPNKTKVMIVNESTIIKMLINQLQEYYIGPLGPPLDFLNAVEEDVQNNLKRKTVPGLDEETVKRLKQKVAEQKEPPVEERYRRIFPPTPDNASQFDLDRASPYEGDSQPPLLISPQKSPLSDHSERDKNVNKFLDGLVENGNFDSNVEDSVSETENNLIIKEINDTKNQDFIKEDKKTESFPMDVKSITLSQWSRGQVQLDGNTVNSSTTITGVKEEANVKPSFIVNIEPLSRTPMKEEPVSQTSERSISSQMGCKDMAGFTKFAAEMTNKITAERPSGISFSKVASELATKWRELQDCDKEVYNQKAKLKKQEKENKANASMRDQLQKFLAKSNEKKVLKKRSFPNTLEIDLSICQVRKAVERRAEKPKEWDLRFVGNLSDEVKAAIEGPNLYLFSEPRLLESLLFYNNLGSMIVPFRVLEKNIPITVESIGESLWSVLVSLETSIDIKNGAIIISDNRITSNGLRIELVRDPVNCHYQITDVPLHIAFFGLDDLKEILSLMETCTDELPLEDCRPLKIITYIRAETIRYISKHPVAPGNDKCIDRFKFWSTSIKDKIKNCPHQNSIYKKLNLNDFIK